nr:MAG: capsid protein [Cressdnaviricota sp.]
MAVTKKFRKGAHQQIVANGLAWLAGRAIKRGIKRKLQNISQTKTKNKDAKDMPVLSHYHEDKVTYRRKEAPKSVRRAAVQKARAAEKILSSNLPSNVIVRNFGKVLTTGAGTTWGSAPSGTQAVYSFGLYGLYGENDSFNDVHSILGSYPITTPLAAGGVQVNTGFSYAANGLKVMFRSALLRVVMNADAANAYPIRVDIYQCRSRRTMTTSAGTPTDLLVADGAIYTTAATASPVYTEYGATPYMFPTFCKGCVILQKREMLLAPGDNTEMELVDRRPYVADGSKLYANFNSASGQKCWSIGNRTIFYLIIVKGGIINSSGNVNTTQGSLNISFEKRYALKVLNQYPDTETRAINA